MFLDTAARLSHVTTHATHSDPWPTLARSTSFFLIMLFNNNFSKKYPALNFSLILIIFITIKSELNVVLLYNFKITFYDKHFEITQVKHTTELISFKTQCNDSTFVDKVFESVFKSWRFEKHVSKRYFKITTINCLSFCFCW